MGEHSDDNKDKNDAAMAKRARVLAVILPIITIAAVGTVIYLKKVQEDPNSPLAKTQLSKPKTPAKMQEVASLPAPTKVSTQATTNAKAATIPSRDKSLVMNATTPPKTSQPKLTPVSGIHAPTNAKKPVASSATSPKPAPKLFSVENPPADKPIAPKPPVAQIKIKSLTSVTSKSQTESQPVLHFVRRGETLFSIGQKFGMEAKSLALANGFPVDAPIVEGQVLRVPGPQELSGYNGNSALIPVSARPQPATPKAPTLIPVTSKNLPVNHPMSRQPAGETASQGGSTELDGHCIRYVVQASDRLESIAAAHGTNPATLSARNNGIRQVRAGQTLVVPVGHILYPYPHYR